MARRVRLIGKEGQVHFQIDSCESQLAAAWEGKIKFHALCHGTYPVFLLKPSQLPGVSSLGFWDGVGGQDLVQDV